MYAPYAILLLACVMLALIPPYRATSHGEPRALDGQRLILSENYWLFAVLKLSGFALGVGFTWAIHDTPDAANSWWIGIPFYVVGLAGVAQLFFRRHHIFYPTAKRVSVEGFSLLRGRFAQSYDYTQLRSDIEERPWKTEIRYSAVFHYPKLKVFFFTSKDKAATEAHLQKLRIVFGMTEAAKTSPHPMAVSAS